MMENFKVFSNWFSYHRSRKWQFYSSVDVQIAGGLVKHRHGKTRKVYKIDIFFLFLQRKLQEQ